MTRSYAKDARMNTPFRGAKLALLTEVGLPVILRDDSPGIPWPGFWDLPGGGRDATETPVECALRETREELALRVAPDKIIWGQAFGKGSARNWFFVARVPQEALRDIQLGSEGQSWQTMPVMQFLDHPKVIPQFQTRLRLFLDRSLP